MNARGRDPGNLPLFLDLPRQRGNEEIEITSRPTANVLRFDHEEPMIAQHTLALVRPSLS